MGDFEEAKSLAFSDSALDRVTIDAVLLEVIERDRQFAVVGAAMLTELDLNAVEHFSGREAEARENAGDLT